MRRGSDTVYHKALESWNALLREKGEGELELAEELFSLVDTLDNAPALLAALEDASRESDARAQLANDVLKGKASGEVLDLVTGLARESWSESGDLLKVMELLGVQTILAGGEREGLLSRMEDELYGTRSIFSKQRDFRHALRDAFYPLEAREQLLATVLTDETVYTKALLKRGLSKVPEMSLPQVNSEYLEAVAERQNHMVASVTTALPLTREEEERLEAVLSKKFNSPVQIHTTIDTSVVGGARVHIGDYVIDGTISSRLATVKEVFNNGR